MFALLGFLFLTSANAYEVKQYGSADGRPLRFVVGSPKAPSDRVFIYIEGDGTKISCYEFEPEKIGVEIDAAAFLDFWVKPETAKQAICGSKEYNRLDFHHRVQEVKNLVAELRRDPRFSTAKIYLVGHSAGVDISAAVASEGSEIEGLVLISGASSNLETMFYAKILLDAQRKNYAEDTIAREFERERAKFAKVKSNCSIEANDWGDRSNLFWCQMMTSNIVENLLKFSKEKKILIVHGRQDAVVPVEEAYFAYANLLANGQNVKLKIYPEMEHDPLPFLTDLLQVITKWAR